MRQTPAGQIPSWEHDGQRLASLLDHVHATVIAAPDMHHAAAVAISIARVQGEQRRVAIADLVGEIPALEALNHGEDQHGISDSFLYGVSLNKIAKQVNESGSVFLMPSGTETVAIEAVYGNDRWRRLAAGFHEVGALLLVVATPGTPGFAALCANVGHLLPVGESRFPMPPGVPIIALPAAPAPPPPPDPPREKAKRAREAAIETSGGRNRKIAAAIVALGAIGLVIGAKWSSIAPYLPERIATMLAPPASDTSHMLVKPTPMDTLQRDRVFGDSTASLTDSMRQNTDSESRPVGPVPALANPADSASASQYAIFYSSANTRREALPDDQLNSQKALAVTPVMLDGAEWIRVFIGAAETRAEADALLVELRTANVVNGGSVTSVPYALRLEGDVAATSGANRIAAYALRGVLAYALQQKNGRLILYSGAFESPIQATTLADSLRALGMTPVLAYRTGRAF